MNYKIGVLAVTIFYAYKVNAIPVLIPCICPQKPDPVCGSDGNTYDNDCRIYCDTKDSGRNVTLVSYGPCPNEEAKVVKALCLCADEEKEVCGSDGKTYPNSCKLNCATAGNSMLRIDHYGSCDSTPKLVEDEGCVCAAVYQPVCGTDGKTYPSECDIKCQRPSKPDVKVAYDGECKEEAKIDEAVCVCTDEQNEVCGSDGIIYANPCKFNCATASNSMLSIDLIGKCDGSPKLPVDEGCFCIALYKPVCGTDGKQYSNECKLICERSTNPDLKVAYEGECVEEAKVVEALCFCADEDNEVCGSDGKTYNNPCKLNCATAGNSMLRIERFGKCDDSPKLPEDEGCFCIQVFAPVCGTDGKTYSNKCVLGCQRFKNPSIGIAHEGACPENNENTPCVCTNDPSPVCGTDGTTYDNPCSLNCAKTNNTILKIDHYGKCDDSVKGPETEGCFCFALYQPVCGTDGKTYSNKCKLKCQRSANPSLEVAHEGKCIDKIDASCTCTDEKNEVCGSNGKTYLNPCKFNCATIKSPVLRIERFGKCEDSPKVPEDKGCFCIALYQPVCGTDGKTYSNKCALGCERSSNPSIDVAHEGACPEVNVKDPCVCAYDPNPVCGTDGTTYDNPCSLNCAKTDYTNLKIDHYGKCDDSLKVPEEDGCVCFALYKPVCGTDGKTYSNSCVLGCKRSAKLNIEVAYEGECIEEAKVVESLCVCTEEQNEVCGSDGNTYPNPCKLNCATAGNSMLKIEYFGKCDSGRKIHEDEGCVCIALYKPVCGSNGKTYSNKCKLNCEKRTSLDLDVAYEGACKEVKVKDPCVCPNDPNPVCGTDGSTYKNPCTLNCIKTNDAKLEVAHFGKCGEVVGIPDVPQPKCICPGHHKPVCASDGITYTNECLLRCAGKNLQIVKSGPCVFSGYTY